MKTPLQIHLVSPRDQRRAHRLGGRHSVSGRAKRSTRPQTKAAVTALTTKILESSQFAHQRLDDELAGRFLDRYLDTLDGGRMVFLQSDEEEFARFRSQLAQATRRSGDTSPAQIIFQRYLERLDQRAALRRGIAEDGEVRFHRGRALSLRPQGRAASARSRRGAAALAAAAAL